MNQNAMQDDSSNWLPADAPSEDFSPAFLYGQFLVPVSLITFLHSLLSPQNFFPSPLDILGYLSEFLAIISEHYGLYSFLNHSLSIYL